MGEILGKVGKIVEGIEKNCMEMGTFWQCGGNVWKLWENYGDNGELGENSMDHLGN